MHRSTKKTARLNIKLDEDLEKYDEILNDPLCTIISTEHIKETEKHYGEEGGLVSQTDSLYILVTYSKKKIF